MTGMLNTAVLGQKQQTETAAPKTDLATKLAIDRTFIAYERTMMAWTRTSASLITFGFTIYKFFQIEMGSRLPPAQVMGPRGFALTLVSIGLFSLLLAAIQNRSNLRTLTGLKVPGSMATLQAVVIAGLGIVALVGIILRG